MKLISWNVNGLRACVTKGFKERFQELDADIFCIQESKLQEGQIELELPGYYQYWNYAVKKGYSGTAIFTKQEPLSVRYGINKMCIRDRYTAGTIAKVPGLMSSGRTLAVHMYALLSEGLYMKQAYATAVVLLVVVLLINAGSGWIAKKLTKR